MQLNAQRLRSLQGSRLLKTTRTQEAHLRPLGTLPDQHKARGFHVPHLLPNPCQQKLYTPLHLPRITPDPLRLLIGMANPTWILFPRKIYRCILRNPSLRVDRFGGKQRKHRGLPPKPALQESSLGHPREEIKFSCRHCQKGSLFGG